MHHNSQNEGHRAQAITGLMSLVQQNNMSALLPPAQADFTQLAGVIQDLLQCFGDIFIANGGVVFSLKT